MSTSGTRMRPLRILHVTPYWADAWGYGGIPRVVGSLCRGLAAAGHDVTVCATDAGSATSRLARPDGATVSAPWPPMRPADELELRVFPNRSNRLAHDWQCFTPVGLNRYLRDHAADFDVAHLHACRNLPGLLAARHLRRHGVPYVVAPNGTAPNIERRRGAKWLVDIAAGRRMLQAAAVVIAVSGAERRQLQALGVGDDRIHVVPNPIDGEEFASPAPRGVSPRRSEGAGPRIVFLGKITPRKRLDVLVRAFAATRARGSTARLVIAGPNMGGRDAALRLADRLGVRSEIDVVDLLAGGERLELLADADVVVYPAEDEVFGLVPVEALMTGTPVVVANDSGCGEIVEALGGGLAVRPGDALALADAVAAVLAEPGRWRRAAAVAGSRARDRFSRDRVSASVADAYAQAIGETATSRGALTGVSVIMPVHNGAATLAAALPSILRECAGRPAEVLVVDDRSIDGSADVLRPYAEAGTIRLLAGSGRGPSAAINLALREASHPVVCQIDQDVELLPGWMGRILSALDRDERLGAVQGHYTTHPSAPLIARAMGLDLELRYAALRNGATDHVCTGNAVYRTAALRQIGGFDETLGYGHDNDVSYRLQSSGWRLGHCRTARSRHQWRFRLLDYCRQQYGFGYGRLDVVARHPGRAAGDRVSPWPMMAHPILMGAALVAMALAAGQGLVGWDWRVTAVVGVVLIGLLATERMVAGLRAFWQFGDAAAFTFPWLHLVRDVAWVVAIIRWCAHRLRGWPGRPADSMNPRPAPARAPGVDARSAGFIPQPARALGVILAYNEATTIAAVVDDVRACCPDLDLLVVDDGSSDDTAARLPRLNVRWLRLPERMGIGHAMRAGLRYASRQGYEAVIRIDGDGQHSAADIAALLAPLQAGRADAVIGSRFLGATGDGPAPPRLVQRVLAACLTRLTGRPVTDPTSGFCALGPRALRVLEEHHPTGYPEPELRLFLSRNRLVAVEAPVVQRPRRGGRSSLTPPRVAAAAARVLLAMLIVPFRQAVRGGDRD